MLYEKTTLEIDVRTAKLRSVGGSTMVALPKAFLDQLDLKPDSPVDISVKDDAIVIGRHKRGRIGLAARLAMCNFKIPLSKKEKAEQRAWDQLRPVGDEVI
jgi:antitoxin component of MazEF toxin-antitoxin module